MLQKCGGVGVAGGPGAAAPDAGGGGRGVGGLFVGLFAVSLVGLGAHTCGGVGCCAPARGPRVSPPPPPLAAWPPSTTPVCWTPPPHRPTHRPCPAPPACDTTPPAPHVSQSAPVAGPPTHNWRARGNGGASPSAARPEICKVTKPAKVAAAAAPAGGQRPPLPDCPPSTANFAVLTRCRPLWGRAPSNASHEAACRGKKKTRRDGPTRCRPCNSPARWAAPGQPQSHRIAGWVGGGLRTAVNSAVGKNPVRHRMEAPGGRCVEGLAREPGSAG